MPRFSERKAWRRLRTNDYSVFDSGLNRIEEAEWQFPQEIATLHVAAMSTRESKTL